MRVYLSGKITDLTVEEYNYNFERAASVVIQAGHDAVSPLEVQLDLCGGVDECGGVGEFHHWRCYMRHDIILLMKCDAIAVLPNWFASGGAKIEVKLADDLKYPSFAISKNYTELRPWRHHG
jgi:hypothetical protein